MRPGTPEDSILLDVFTVSPNKQYRGILLPTTPEQTSPVWTPTRIWHRTPLGITNLEAAARALQPKRTVALAAVSMSRAFTQWTATLLLVKPHMESCSLLEHMESC